MSSIPSILLLESRILRRKNTFTIFTLRQSDLVFENMKNPAELNTPDGLSWTLYVNNNSELVFKTAGLIAKIHIGAPASSYQLIGNDLTADYQMVKQNFITVLSMFLNNNCMKGFVKVSNKSIQLHRYL